jgi:hypothetical protein
MHANHMKTQHAFLPLLSCIYCKSISSLGMMQVQGNLQNRHVYTTMTWLCSINWHKRRPRPSTQIRRREELCSHNVDQKHHAGRTHGTLLASTFVGLFVGTKHCLDIAIKYTPLVNTCLNDCWILAISYWNVVH